MSEKEQILNHLKENYSKPGHEIAFSGINNLYNYYNKRLSKKDIEDFLATVYTYTIHKEVKKGIQNPVFKYFSRYQWQADLIQITNVSKYNNNFKFILSVIDIYTRFAWLRLLSSKRSDETCEKFLDILSTVKKEPMTICTDKGGELKNTLFKKMCESRNIILFHNSTNNHAPFVERFNRSIQRIIYQYCSTNGTYQFYDKLPLLLDSYNSRPHRMLGNQISPKKAESGLFDTEIAMANEKYLSKFKRKQPKYKKNTLVRIQTEKVKFHKGFRPNFSKQIFKIYKIKNILPIPLYTLCTPDDSEIIEGNFYESQITPVKDQDYRIERVLKKKAGKSLIRWEGYPESYDSWIDTNSIRNIKS